MASDSTSQPLGTLKVKRRGFRLGVGMLMGMIAVISVCLWGASSLVRSRGHAVQKIAGSGMIYHDITLTDLFWRPTGDQVLARAFRIDLTGTLFTDDELEKLCRLTDASTLDLSDTKITDRGLEHLVNIKHLEYLGLRGTQITDAGIDSILRLPNLQELAVSHTRLTEEGMLRLKEALPSVIFHD